MVTSSILKLTYDFLDFRDGLSPFPQSRGRPFGLEARVNPFVVTNLVLKLTWDFFDFRNGLAPLPQSRSRHVGLEETNVNPSWLPIGF